jgi:hypothetical protein
MAILTWLSLAYAAIAVPVLAAVLVTILRRLRRIDTVLRDLHWTRLRIAARNAPLDVQFGAVAEGTASAAESLAAVVASIRRAQAAADKVA